MTGSLAMNGDATTFSTHGAALAASSVRRRRSNLRRVAGAVVGALALGMNAAGAEQPARAEPPAPSGAAAGETVETRRAELQKLENDITVSDDQRRQIQADLEAIRTDRVRLSAALIDTNDKVQAAESKVAALEARLEGLAASEDAIRTSLEGRRDTIADVLAALQRMGRRPLPAILVRPDDMLAAVRTAMLLGAVVPELRAETEALASDLAELVRIRTAIAADRDTLSQEVATLSTERAKLPGLIAARQEAQAKAEGKLRTEQDHAADLSRQATSLKDLIARLGNEEAARRAAEQAPPRPADAQPGGPPAAPFRDPARLAPAIAFEDAKGLLPLPAAGTILKRFGSDDGFGSAEHGISISTRQRASVSSPTDGWISFSGPYRTYGQLLIINAGGGYYIVLAGMDHANVTIGQFVLAGEPVGAMGDGSVRTAAAIALGAAQPVLYVEFRKDGAAVDPSPWWAKADSEKVRG